jgi:hypothetical protein
LYHLLFIEKNKSKFLVKKNKGMNLTKIILGIVAVMMMATVGMAANNTLDASVTVCGLPSISVNTTPLTFGTIHSGNSSISWTYVNLSENNGGCDTVPVNVTLGVNPGNWSGSANMTTNLSVALNNPYVVNNSTVSVPLGFTLNVGSDVLSGNYTEPITISVTY